MAKQCRACGSFGPFFNNRAMRDGLSTQCKTCHAKERRRKKCGCGGLISTSAIRCMRCHLKQKADKKTARVKEVLVCPDCGGPKSVAWVERCWNCSWMAQRKVAAARERVCAKCGGSGPFSKNSSSPDGLCSTCKDCTNKYSEGYRKENKDKIRVRDRAYKEKNGEDLRRKTRSPEYRERANKRRKEIRHLSTAARVHNTIGCAIRLSLKDQKKTRSWELIAGYSTEELMAHLESKFEIGMTWGNYGKFGWHIDHIKPISSFIAQGVNDEVIKRCWSLANLRPLWWRENLSKGPKVANRRRSR